MSKKVWIVGLIVGAAMMAAAPLPTSFFARISYHPSLQAGVKNPAGKLITGTEIMHLVPFKGRLYAANDLWMEKDPQIPKACQVLVLDSPKGQWRVDHQFAANNLRLVTLKPVTFTTDEKGKAVAPVTMLLAAPDVAIGGTVEIYSRDDEAAKWVPMPLGQASKYSTTRTIGFHRDKVTGVDRVFAGNDTLGTLTGVYDPRAPGRIRWEKSPEFEVPRGERVMGFCDCNGVFYCATTCNIFRRTDGATPSRKQVYYRPEEKAPVGIRGLTAVPNPTGAGEVLLFAALSKVRRIDPSENFKETIELGMPSFLTGLLGIKVSFALAAYNEFMPFTIPGSGETVWLFGFESSYPAAVIETNPPPKVRLFVREETKWYFAAEARYFIRHAKGRDIRYEVAEVTDPRKPTLVAVRTIALSPFVADRGQALYFGGFDCNSQPSHNTAWVYRGELPGR